jgi:hypothetical protein
MGLVAETMINAELPAMTLDEKIRRLLASFSKRSSGARSNAATRSG